MSVLSDGQILARPQLLNPFRPEHVQPASVDLLLGSQFRVYEGDETVAVDLAVPASYQRLTKLVKRDLFVLHPGEFVLATTQEWVSLPPEIMARVEGKSSLGRLGLIVHATAGFIDPGFEGQITLEMTNLLRIPIILRSGVPICQVSFTFMSQTVDKPYNGRYQGQSGVTESKFAAV